MGRREEKKEEADLDLPSFLLLRTDGKDASTLQGSHWARYLLGLLGRPCYQRDISETSDVLGLVGQVPSSLGHGGEL